MVKPRHHTLQGICQDVCVNYQQVVEVHRRIREVVLEENGKVITQNLGTFFCRDVKPRSGVLNNVPWDSDGFFEVGLKGERSERDGSHSVGTAERVSFALPTGNLSGSLFGALFGVVPFRLLEFSQDDNSIIGTPFSNNQPVRVVDQNNPDRSTVPLDGLRQGFSNVVFEIRESDNSANQFFEQLSDSEALLLVNGERVAMGGSVGVDVRDPVVIGYDGALFQQQPTPDSFVYRITYTFLDGDSV